MMTTQDVGSDEEFQTRYYKVSSDYTPTYEVCGGI